MQQLRPIDLYFESQKEPAAGCMQALRSYLALFNSHITEEWKYGMPFFYYKRRMFCYLWTQKATGMPYIGIVNGGALSHPELVQDKRKRMKVLPIDPGKDLPLKKIKEILNAAIDFQEVLLQYSLPFSEDTSEGLTLSNSL